MELCFGTGWISGTLHWSTWSGLCIMPDHPVTDFTWNHGLFRFLLVIAAVLLSPMSSCGDFMRFESSKGSGRYKVGAQCADTEHKIWQESPIQPVFTWLPAAVQVHLGPIPYFEGQDWKMIRLSHGGEWP